MHVNHKTEETTTAWMVCFLAIAAMFLFPSSKRKREQKLKMSFYNVGTETFTWEHEHMSHVPVPRLVSSWLVRPCMHPASELVRGCTMPPTRRMLAVRPPPRPSSRLGPQTTGARCSQRPCSLQLDRPLGALAMQE